jgi:hypothetical protein
MKRDRIILEILSGRKPESELILFEKKFPGITFEFKKKSDLLKSLSMKKNIVLNEAYFDSLINRSFEKAKKSHIYSKFAFAGIAAVLLMLVFYFSFNQKEGTNIISDNYSMFNNLQDEEILNVVGNDYLAENNDIDFIPDSLLTDLVYENVSYSMLIDYYFNNVRAPDEMETSIDEMEIIEL